MRRRLTTVLLAAGLAALVVPPAASASQMTFLVTNLNPSGAGSLSQAITDANANALTLDEIDFDSSLQGTINQNVALPPINDAVTIEGSTAQGASPGHPTIRIDGAGAPGGTIGLSLVGGSGGSMICNLMITRFTTDAININGSSGNTVEGNIIGTDLAGTTGLGSSGNGIGMVNSDGNQIGGLAAGEGNVVAGQTVASEIIANGTSDFNTIEGNLVGTDPTGSFSEGGSVEGVFLGGTINTVQNNLISGNQSDGVFVSGNANQVINNRIGTNSAGTAAVPNGNSGIYVGSAANTNISGNVISGNTGPGVAVTGPTATGNTLRGNLFSGNSELGIDLGDDGVTPNDFLDGDASPNEFQNYPVLSSAVKTPGTTTVQGTLSSSPSTTYTLDFYANSSCDPSGFGEGETYLGTLVVATNATGDAPFTANLPAATFGSDAITAIATDPAWNTSEFSACTVASPPPPVLAQTVNLFPVSGTVLVRPAGSTQFSPLLRPEQVSVGAEVDTRAGRVRIVSRAANGATQTADFYQGMFVVTQARNHGAFVELRLSGPRACSNKKANAASSTGALATAAAGGGRLWGSGRGRYRTRGRRGAATVRATTWLTQDKCHATKFFVAKEPGKHSIIVDDFGLPGKKNKVLTEGHHYTAE